MTRRATTVVIFLAVCAAGCAEKPSPRAEEPPVAVRTVVVTPETVERRITATGALEPQARVIVAAQQEGLVTAVRVREGDRVRAGETVIELDDRELRAQLAEEEARRVEAEAQWRRMAALVDEGLVSPAAGDSARATFEAATARSEGLRTRLSFTRVTAPVDGVVTARLVEVGNLAAARSPLLELAAGSGLILRVPVSELDVVHLRPGDGATVTVDALPGVRVASHIARIFPAADPLSRQVTVELALEATPHGVRPGFLARAELVIERVAGGFTVPEPAVLRGSDVPFFVYRVVGGRAEVRPVVVGDRMGGRVLIREGLAAGDEIVVEGMGRLRPGAAVVVQPAEGRP